MYTDPIVSPFEQSGTYFWISIHRFALWTLQSKTLSSFHLFIKLVSSEVDESLKTTYLPSRTKKILEARETGPAIALLKYILTEVFSHSHEVKSILYWKGVIDLIGACFIVSKTLNPLENYFELFSVFHIGRDPVNYCY